MESARRRAAHAPAYCVIHIARRPFTGVWSVMEALARHQAHDGLPVAVGIIETPWWRRQYAQRLRLLRTEGVSVFSSRSLDVPFSVAFPAHMAAWSVFGSPLRRWAEAFAREAGVEHCVLHCHNAWLSGSYVPIRSGKIRMGAVATYHGIQGAPQLRAQPLRRRLHRYLAQRFVRYGGVLASVDHANVQVANELFGIDPRRFAVVPNGVPPCPARGCPSLQGGEGFAVGHVGTLNEGKGWKLTARAVEAMRRAGQPVRLILAGGGPQSDEARQWCAERPEFTEFLGEVPNAAFAVMPRLDAFCLMSAGEGMPMAALEALAAGVPVLATPVGGLAEIVRDGSNGYLVSRSAEALADRLDRLTASQEHLVKLHRGALSSFHERYHVSATDRHYRELYCKALHSRSRVP